jgi:hypothetical protein
VTLITVHESYCQPRDHTARWIDKQFLPVLRISCPFLTHLRTSRSPTITSARFDVNRGKSPIRKLEEQESGHTSRTRSPTLRAETVWKAELAHWEEWKNFWKHHHRSLPDEARSFLCTAKSGFGRSNDIAKDEDLLELCESTPFVMRANANYTASWTEWSGAADWHLWDRTEAGWAARVTLLEIIDESEKGKLFVNVSSSKFWEEENK